MSQCFISLSGSVGAKKFHFNLCNRKSWVFETLLAFELPFTVYEFSTFWVLVRGWAFSFILDPEEARCALANLGSWIKQELVMQTGRQWEVEQCPMPSGHSDSRLSYNHGDSMNYLIFLNACVLCLNQHLLCAYYIMIGAIEVTREESNTSNDCCQQ